MKTFPTMSPEELEAILEHSRQLRAEAARDLFASVGRWLRRKVQRPFGRRPGAQHRPDCTQAA